MSIDQETWDAKKAEVAAKIAAYDALPEQAKQLVEHMKQYFLPRGQMAELRALQETVLKIWGTP